MNPANQWSHLGRHLAKARKACGLSQSALAALTDLEQTHISRIEGGRWLPSLRILTTLARSLDVSLQFFIEGKNQAADDARSITVELRNLGIRDLSTANAVVPGAFREKEHVLALALVNDAPDPRVVVALPWVLYRHQWDAVLFSAYALRYDQRAIHRAAWLIEIGRILQRKLGKSSDRNVESSLQDIINCAQKPAKPDSLGFAADNIKTLPPVYRRWNITNATTIDEFAARWTLSEEFELEAVHHE